MTFPRWQNFTILVGTFKFRLTEPHNSISKWLQRWQNITFFVGTLKSQLENTDYYSNDYKDDRPWHSLLVYSNFNWKKLYIFCWDIQIPTGKNSSLSKWLQRWQNLTSFGGHSNSNWKKKQLSIEMISKITDPKFLCRDIQNPTKKENSVSKRFERSRKTLHPLWGHSNPNWKRQFIIEMITKMTEPYIFCGDIQIPTEKDSSVFKWFQIWRNLTYFVGTFKFQLKKTVQYLNNFKYEGTKHIFLGHSNSNWKRQFSIEIITELTELYILWGDIQIPTEKAVQ